MYWKRVFNLSQGSLLKPGNNSSTEKTKPLLVMTFDDGYETDYSHAYQKMNGLGIKGTSYLNTANVGRLNEILTWDKIHEMHNNGWDFQCHTHTHARLSEVTVEQTRTEMESVNSAFIANGLPAPEHHAFPYGVSGGDVIRNTIMEYRLTTRRTGAPSEGNVNSYRTINEDLRGVGASAQSEQEYQDLVNIIDYTIRNGKIIVLYSHQIIPEPGETYHIVAEYFDRLMDYIASTGIETLTISELYERLIQE